MGELIFIGLGLHHEKDMSLMAAEEGRKCDVLFTEFYTSVHEGSDIRRLESILGKKVRILKREEVEEGSIILNEARSKKVGLLVPGDPMSATTHVDLRLRAEKEGIRTRVIHGASIVTAAAGLLGLQVYKFGRSTTIPFKKKGYEPSSPYDVIRQNRELGFHTLVLLDIDEEGMRTLDAVEALRYLLEIEEKQKGGAITMDTLACIVADAGSQNPYVKAGYIKSLLRENVDKKAQTLVIPGKLHFMEAEALTVLAGAPEGIGV